MVKRSLMTIPLLALLALGGAMIQCGHDTTAAGTDDLRTGDSSDALLFDHVAADLFEDIPDSVVEQISGAYTIFYGHTSHGSQIMTGLAMLEGEDALYDYPPFYEVGDDLGGTGDTSWAPITRAWLDDHPEYNMVVWSWCGGCSDNTEAGIDLYLNTYASLEAAYPNVTFVYMTGHLDGTGADGNLYARNIQIRDYCRENGKVLFDFADIESYDPSGTYYPDETDACGWCVDWCAEYDCVTCGSCAHSHCFNCYRKGKAFWYLLATLTGWNAD
jgi:hypothetical protein